MVCWFCYAECQQRIKSQAIPAGELGRAGKQCVWVMAHYHLGRGGGPGPGGVGEQEGDDMEDLDSQVCTPQHALQTRQVQQGCIVHHPALPKACKILLLLHSTHYIPVLQLK